MVNLPVSPDRYRILIPAHNEQDHIADVVIGCLKWNTQVWVVCDACTDKTVAYAKQAGAQIFITQESAGKGAALRLGWHRLLQDKDWDYLIILDGDGQHCPEDIPNFLSVVNTSKPSIIIGSRAPFLPPMPFMRRWTNRIMSLMTSLLTGQWINDSQCGFRLLSRQFIEQCSWYSQSFEIETEMILNAKTKHLTISTVPVTTIYESEESSIRPGLDTYRWLNFLLKFKQNQANS